MVIAPDLMISPASDATLAERLRGYAGDVTLIADQLDALNAGSVLRFRLIAAERARLRAGRNERGEGILLATPDQPGETVAELDRLLAEAEAELQDRTASGDMLRERMQQIGDAAMRVVRRLDLRRVERGSYGPEATPAHRLDLRR